MTDLALRAQQTREVRTAAVLGAEVRTDADGGFTFEGDAAMLDQPYEVEDFLGVYEETLARGAFKKTLSEQDDIRLLVNHTGIAIARTKPGTLSLEETRSALHATATLDPGNPTVQEVRSAMNRGDLDQMSFAFRATRQEWNEDYSKRTILEAKLYDVSVVTYPANPATSASLRSMLDVSIDLDDPELVKRAIEKLSALLPEERAEIEVTGPSVDDLLVLWSRRYAA